ncbi:hypothetical protein PLICRDRAFT_37376 [Plicaturopsis crispa FD-325 SS-3]|nr:hypothetical protein PLICRDRAFT_37376 [Plicaturopsis crispa FD-325 SS-3]
MWPGATRSLSASDASAQCNAQNALVCCGGKDAFDLIDMVYPVHIVVCAISGRPINDAASVRTRRLAVAAFGRHSVVITVHMRGMHAQLHNKPTRRPQKVW